MDIKISSHDAIYVRVCSVALLTYCYLCVANLMKLEWNLLPKQRSAFVNFNHSLVFVENVSTWILLVADKCWKPRF